MTNRIGLLFPGQGAQSVGMLGDFAQTHPLVRSTFDEASAVLGYDLWQLAQEGPLEKQKETEFTQPLMLASGVSCARVWLETAGLPATVVAGHSVGEYAALVISGALEFADAVALVKQRAVLMAASAPAGSSGMAALIGMDDQAAVKLCSDVSASRRNDAATADSAVVEAVNFNAPGQVVISGHLLAIEEASQVAREHGARKVMPLPVSVANHSALMRTAGKTLVQSIDAISWKTPLVPVVQNVSGSTAVNLDDLLENLRSHVYTPVKWVDSILHMIDKHQVDQFIELGAGKVLTGMGKRIAKEHVVMPVFDAESLQQAQACASLSEVST